MNLENEKNVNFELIDEGKLSIIIPIYNSGEYLETCIESIIQQTYENIELILVDNLSTDDSLQICYQFADRDFRVKILQENKKGAAAARNCGMACARGEYLTFVDSDDYIEKDMYLKMLTLMEQEEADAVCCSFNYIYNTGETIGWYEPKTEKYLKKNRFFTGKDIAEIFLTSKDIEGFSWNKIFKRQLILEADLKFDEEKEAFEDMVFVFSAILKCERISLCGEKLYYYRQRENSLVNSVNLNSNYYEYNDSIKQIYNIAKTYGLNDAAEAFKIVREIWWRFVEIKRKSLQCDYRGGCLREYKFRKIVFNILKYQKTEKIKTLIKAIYLKICAR